MALSLASAVSPADSPQFPPSAGRPCPKAHAAVTAFVERLSRALADRPVAERLSEAGVIVRIDLTDIAGQAITMSFDRAPASVRLGTAGEWPTLRLWLASSDLDAFHAEESHLPMKILSGEVRFEGAVRKLLRVMPIIRRALTEQIAAAQAADDPFAVAVGVPVRVPAPAVA